MATRNPPSSNAGYEEIAGKYAANIPGSGTSQQNLSYHQHLETPQPVSFPHPLSTGYAFSSHGQSHFEPSQQQLEGYMERNRQVLSQQQLVHSSQQHLYNHQQQPFHHSPQQPLNYPQQPRNLPQQTLNHPQQTLNHPQQPLNYPQQTLNHPQQTLNHPQQTLNHPQQPLKQQPPQPIEQMRTSPNNQRELVRVTGEEGFGSSTPNDTIMNEAYNDFEQSGEMTKQSAAVGMDTPQPSVVAGHGGNASKNSTAKQYHGGHEQGSSCNSRPQVGGVYSTPDGSFPQSQSPKETQTKHQGVLGQIGSAIQYAVGMGMRDVSNEQQYDTEKLHEVEIKNRKEALKRKDGELRRKDNELRRKDDELRSMEGELRRKEDELRRTRDDQKSEKSRAAKLRADLEDAKNQHNCEVDHLMSKINEYKATAEKLTEQLSSLEQSNSKQVGGTGAHKDSHAIPPNLVKSATSTNQAAFACTKSFIAFLKERNALESHRAWRSVPKRHDDRYRKHAVQEYICSRLFAGFENESYMDSLDCGLGSPYLPGNWEESEFFLKTQDLELRQKQYLHDYDTVKDLGLQKIMDILKAGADGGAPFFQFCCRKFVRIMNGVDGFVKEFPASGDYSERSLLHQLATHPMYCDKLLKPFVNLAMAAFLMHRLAFQFNPPARIFRYARGTAFDKKYMENAVPMDDDDSDEGLVVGLTLVPGFQVGNTIVKCVVYLVPCSPVTARRGDHTNH